MTPHADLVARLELALNEALLGRGIVTANVQRNYRLSFSDADRLMNLRAACFDALGALAALPPPADPPSNEASQAYGYLSRLFKHCAPQCEPLPDLMGLCTQIDNLIVGLRQRPADPPALVALVRVAAPFLVKEFDKHHCASMKCPWCDLVNADAPRAKWERGE